MLWLAGFGFWLATLYWLTYPHPATSLGWLALSAYLGCYLPVFVGLGRVLVHAWRVPLVVAAPLVWAALELAQAHLLTGFNLAALGHTQYRWIALVQIAELCGGYGVSMLVMFVAASAAQAAPCGPSRARLAPLVPAALAVAAALAFGHWRLATTPQRAGPQIALVQGSIDTAFKHDPAEAGNVYREYLELSEAARREHPQLDLIVWPETMFRDPLLLYTADVRPPPDALWTVDQLRSAAEAGRLKIALTARRLDTPLLLGIDALKYGPGSVERYNSALHVARDGQILDRYDKMHPVLFGEYVPLGRRFPWLYRLTPLGDGLDAGRQPQAMRVGDALVAPNICYESILPHLIRRQIVDLDRQGQQPDVLINLTNDGWFYGSSELDLHLICGVFRAIECRRPFLAAANTGFSAWIDSTGRIIQQGPRRDRGWIIASVQLDGRPTAYLALGDVLPTACLALCLAAAVSGLWRAWRRGKPTASGEAATN